MARFQPAHGPTAPSTASSAQPQAAQVAGAPWRASAAAALCLLDQALPLALQAKTLCPSLASFSSQVCTPCPPPLSGALASWATNPPFLGQVWAQGWLHPLGPGTKDWAVCDHPRALLEHRCSSSLPKPTSQFYTGPSLLWAVPTWSRGEGMSLGMGTERLGSDHARVGGWCNPGQGGQPQGRETTWALLSLFTQAVK